MTTNAIRLMPGIHANLWLVVQDRGVFLGVGHTPLQAVADTDPTVFRRHWHYTLERCTPGVTEELYHIGGGISHRIRHGFIEDDGPGWYVDEETA